MVSSTTFDRNLHNKASQNFIPIACHYNEHTLLTKNGELLQTIQIDGIQSDQISENLSNLREVVRESIRNVIGCQKFAFWVHTVRKKEDLDDDSGYTDFISTNIHELWRIKNYWDDKFVNSLYITVIHQAPKVNIKNFNSWLHSFSPNTISDFEEKFFEQASEELNNTVNLIIEGVSAYKPQKLGIRIDETGCYSDQMFLYRRIIQLNEKLCPVPISDVSSTLASHQYSVGNDKIEITGPEGKRIAAIMSLKEYKDVSAESLDKFLQIPVEMIITEVFYFIDGDEVISVFKDQDYILGISGDAELRELKGLDVVMDKDSHNVHFCHQQISFMVIGDDLEELDERVQYASKTLSQLGIVHVREDINLEKTFWAQLPANFSFLARLRPTTFMNVAALASLHNFPTGNQYNIWGKSVTLLNTDHDTPYFMNFHDQTNVGTTCIFGEEKSGKTTLMNFLISEAEKYNPTTLYLTDDMDSGLYIKARGGRWFQRDKNIVNPLLCEDTEVNREFLFNFFKVISSHYFDPLTESELIILKALSATIFKLPKAKRKLSIVIQILATSIEGGEGLQKRWAVYLPGGLYDGVFERDEPIELLKGEIVAINLQSFDKAAYIKANRPKEKKFMDQFKYDLNVMQSVKAAIVLSVQNLMHTNIDGPKIFAVDNLSELMDFKYYASLFPVLAQNMTSINGVFISSINIDILQKLHTKKVLQEWISNVNTSFILPSELSMMSHANVLSLNKTELAQLSKLDAIDRQFLIKQDGKTIGSELPIDSLPGMTRLLCSGKEEREIYKEVMKEHGDKKNENWVQHLYEELSNVI